MASGIAVLSMSLSDGLHAAELLSHPILELHMTLPVASACACDARPGCSDHHMQLVYKYNKHWFHLSLTFCVVTTTPRQALVKTGLT